MLYTVAKLTALLSGVAMAADHSVPHSDETEHMEDEDAHGPTLCWDVIHEIFPFCDVSEWPSLKLTNRHICQVIRERAFAETKTRFGDRFIGDYANYMREFEHGIVQCDSIDQVIESLQFSRSIPVYLTPRFCDKHILYRPMVCQKHSDIKPTLKLQPYCEMPWNKLNENVSRKGDYPDSFANDHLIGYLENKPVLMNIRTGQVTEPFNCSKVRFLNQRTLVLFNRNGFRFYDLFDGKGGFFGVTHFLSQINQWSVTQSESGLNGIFCEYMSSFIQYWKMDNSQGKWIKKTIEYEKSGESEKGFQQCLSTDGSVMIAIESFYKKCSLVNLIDPVSETIQRTVMLPFVCNVRETKLSKKTAYFRTESHKVLLLDLETGQWSCLTELGRSFSFEFMGDSRFCLSCFNKGHCVTHIRSQNDPFTDLVTFNGAAYPLSSDLLMYEGMRKFMKLVELTDDSEQQPDLT